MKRSELLLQGGVYQLLYGTVTSAFTIAFLCWIPSAWMSNPMLAVILGLFALAGTVFAAVFFHASIRYLDRSQDEARREWRAEVRPRL